MKVAIVTLNGNDNYGNKLQHYAVQKYLENSGVAVKTISFLYYNQLNYYIKHFLKYLLRKRYRNFCKFDRLINYYNKKIFYRTNLIIPNNLDNEFDTFFVGSDQVWNSSINCFSNHYLLSFVKDNRKKNSISASFGISNIPAKDEALFENELKKFNSISVREYRGKELVEKLTNRNDVEVLVDPTMLLSSDEWDKVSKRPKQLNKIGNKKYILNYFLGNLSEERGKEIDRIAKENDCYVINILDKNDPFYVCGPSEFLYLEKHAFLICTDSFHSSVFAILYNTPFIVFDREDNVGDMSSRIDTLLSKFKLEDRKYNGKISDKLLKCDYKDAYKILEVERKKSDDFLRRALDIKD